jgi:hypothetical protein
LLWWLAGIVILLGALALLWGANMRRGLNHDEHQFVAAGTLIARTGAVPYRDFPYFHMPLLAYLNAALFQWNDSLLLAARTLSVAAAWGALVWVFILGRRLGACLHALLAGSAAVALLLMTPLLLYTSGRAWNHDVPLLLTLCAIGTQQAALGQRGQNRWGLFVLTGALVGLAAATRSSYLFLAPGFALALAFVGAPRRELVAAWAALLIGGVLGGAPALWLLFQEPAGFWFGNWVYNVQLNPAWYRAEGAADQMTVLGKLGALGGLWLAQPANLLVPLLLAGVLGSAWPRRREWSPLAGLALLLLPLALAGALSASPAQPQYWYPLYPLAVVAILSLVPAVGRPVVGIAALGVAALLAMLLTGPAYGDGVQILAEAERWYPNKIHRRGGQMAALVGETSGEVVTLAPIWPLEGKLAIDPSLVTGSWRPHRRGRLPLALKPTTLPTRRRWWNLPAVTAIYRWCWKMKACCGFRRWPSGAARFDWARRRWANASCSRERRNRLSSTKWPRWVSRKTTTCWCGWWAVTVLRRPAARASPGAGRPPAGRPAKCGPMVTRWPLPRRRRPASIGWKWLFMMSPRWKCWAAR